MKGICDVVRMKRRFEIRRWYTDDCAKARDEFIGVYIFRRSKKEADREMKMRFKRLERHVPDKYFYASHIVPWNGSLDLYAFDSNVDNKSIY